MVGNDSSLVKHRKGRNVDIGTRLKKERLRLGLSQQELAEQLGVVKKSQTNYELGHSLPAASYLAHCARIGIDVSYVLTGEHSPTIASDEQILLRLYRAASRELRAAMLAGLGAGTLAPSSARSAAPDDPSRASERSAVVAIHGGEQGQVIAGNARQDNLSIRVGGAKKKRGHDDKV